MRKSTTRQFESRLPRAVSDHRCEITGVKFLAGLPSRCVYIDLEEKTLQPLQNPFGPKVYRLRNVLLPMSPERTSGKMVSRDGVEPPTPAFSDLEQ